MSKSGKLASKERNRRAKAARREANRLHYQRLAAEGSNSKKKTSRKSVRTIRLKEAHTHYCGNAGCKRCSLIKR